MFNTAYNTIHPVLVYLQYPDRQEKVAKGLVLCLGISKVGTQISVFLRVNAGQFLQKRIVTVQCLTLISQLRGHPI